MAEPPAYGQRSTSNGVFYLDGKPMEWGADRVCESCGTPIHSLHSKNLRVMI